MVFQEYSIIGSQFFPIFPDNPLPFILNPIVLPLLRRKQIHVETIFSVDCEIYKICTYRDCQDNNHENYSNTDDKQFSHAGDYTETS